MRFNLPVHRAEPTARAGRGRLRRSALGPLAVGLAAALTFLATPTGQLGGPPAAEASVSLAVTLEELVDHADLVVVARASERHSQWEDVGDGRRIVTYTKVELVRTVAGAAPEELWIRTLGGVVDRIGQQVEGEARLPVGSRALLFLTRAPDDAWVVTARAQGHFPLAATREGKTKLRRSPDLGAIVARKGPSVSVQETLVGRELEAALQAVRSTWIQRHESR